ncbi:MAG: hemerythrin family protein [Holophagaceae bacterium]|nr:hemerythrin family protein [Holophagaceae bacterium]
MDFRSFWLRLILRRKDTPGATPKAKDAAAGGHPQAPHKGGPGFTTGVTKLDDQHHEIREAILGLQKELGRGSAPESHLPTLDALLQRMNDHFRYEESYLEHIKFPDLAHHKGEHDRFRSDVSLLRERLADGDQGVSLDLSSFLFNWFRRHTLEEDATFAKRERPR